MFCHPKKPMMPMAAPVTTQVMPAKVHPTKYQMHQKVCEYIVPEVHPSHTDYVTHHNYKHIHSFPQTVSYDQTITNQQFVQPPTPPVVVPRPGVGQFGPGVAGAGMTPYGPGVAGAGFTGPRPPRGFF